MTFRDPRAAQAGGYVLALAGLLVAIGLLFHPVPSGGFEEQPSVLATTPWWGPIGYGWLGNPLFLAGLTVVALLEVQEQTVGMTRAVAWFGLVMVILSWGRGVGSATGLYFLEPLIFANVPAFLWLAYYGFRVAALARTAVAT